MELTLGQCASLACILEATAQKPGNVHRGADFEDVAYPDFLVSAAAIAPAFDRAATTSVGRTVLESVEATRTLVGTNTNLGMILLMAPLAKVPRDQSLRDGIGAVLESHTAEDAPAVYAAIALAQPGGMGKVDQSDVAGPPPQSLLAAMHLAADRDLIAKQYVTGFSHVLDRIVPWLTSALREKQWPLADAIVHVFVQSLAAQPDSLIARKRGIDVARRASQYAEQVLAAGDPGTDNYEWALNELDFWLRSDGQRRNPGTTADLVAAGLFACLRDGIIEGPIRLADTITSSKLDR